MTQRRTQKEFEVMISKLPKGSFEVLGVYVDALTKIFFRCKVCHHVFLMRPTRILEGGQCAMCKKLKRLNLFEFVISRKPRTHVLIVDDDTQNLEFCKRVLVKRGCHVTTTSKGETSLKLYEKMPPDIILLNLLLPDIDGLEILVKLSQKFKIFHAITMSATQEQPLEFKRILQSTKFVGASETLEKPFTEAQLLKKIDDILTKYISYKK